MLMILLATGCSYNIPVSVIEDAIKVCETHKGLYDLYIDSDRMLYANCNDHTTTLIGK